jgi:hypothetical protein
MVFPLKTILLLLAIPVWAQTNNTPSTNQAMNHPPSPLRTIQSQTNRSLSVSQQVEARRMDCIEHRRTICGKILKVLPEGLVVDSGYTNLMGRPLNHSWLVPGSVKIQPAAHLVEADQPDCACVGLVFLTDLPKKPSAKLYDYVILTGYPMGQYTYTSVGDLRRTVRRFSANLAKAARWQWEENEQPKPNHQF